jgi:hypothetical protein
MNKHEKLLNPFHVVDLANRLSRIREVAAFDTSGEPQGDTIAHALDGWEDSLAEILDVLLPKLVKDKTASSEHLNDTLYEIGEQLRHILYHIQDTKYFGYLLNDRA